MHAASADLYTTFANYLHHRGFARNHMIGAYLDRNGKRPTRWAHDSTDIDDTIKSLTLLDKGSSRMSALAAAAGRFGIPVTYPRRSRPAK